VSQANQFSIHSHLILIIYPRNNIFLTTIKTLLA